MTEVIAHRGASRRARENTVDAFRLAVEMGAHGVELDARRTLDGVVVVHHNPALDDGRVIVETPWRELPAHVPTLGEALDACAGAWVDIEIKNAPGEPDFDPDDRVAVDVLADLAERGGDRWLISSFRLATVDRCRALAPDVPTAWLVLGVEESVPTIAAERGHAAINPWEQMLTEEVVDRCHAAGLAVHTWTCDDLHRGAELASWGVDGIVTNTPDELLDALSGR